MDNITELFASLLKSIELEEEKINLQRRMVYSLYQEYKIKFTDEQKKLIYKLLVVPKFGSPLQWLEVFLGSYSEAAKLIERKPMRKILEDLEKMYGDKDNGQN